MNETVWNGNEAFITTTIINVIFAIFSFCTRRSNVYDFIFVAFFHCRIWNGMGDYWHQKRSERNGRPEIAYDAAREGKWTRDTLARHGKNQCLRFTFGLKCSEYKLNVIGLLSSFIRSAHFYRSNEIWKRKIDYFRFLCSLSFSVNFALTRKNGPNAEFFTF